MKIKHGIVARIREQRSQPRQLINYLSYALEDVRMVSPRSAQLLASVIAILAQDSLTSIAEKSESSPWVH
jgi:hypothetical protein